MARYDGKPFLKLIDCYVLDAIDALDNTELAALEKMEPKLNEVYGVSGSWREIVASEMRFPADLPEKINSIWRAGSSQMREQGLEPDPQEFTRQFVDTNFPSD